MQIIYKNPHDLIPYEFNNKKHDETQVNRIANSIKEFGFTQPVVIDKNNVLIIGHGRVEASKKLGIEEVPCYIMEDLNEKQIKKLRILDNKLNESERDAENLKVDLDDLSDFNIGDLEISIEELFPDISTDEEETEVEEDEFEDSSSEAKIVRGGDLFLVGNHRLFCGDSTKDEDCSTLMNGEIADLVFTDPPYNCNYGNIKHPKFKVRNIENDNMSGDEFFEFCEGFCNNIKKYCRGCVYMCAGQGKDGRIMFSVADEILTNSTTVIRNKDQFTLGRGKYQNKYEPIRFGRVEDGTDFTDDRKLTNVRDIPRPKKSELHPTMKPIEIVATALKHNPKSKTVLDLFGGSGTTLIACEQLKRRCFMMELDPHYIEVIIRRFHKINPDAEIKCLNREIDIQEILSE